MNVARLITAFCLGVCALLAPLSASADTTCTANITAMEFINVDAAGTTDVNATVSYSCRTDQFTIFFNPGQASVRMCVGLDAGTGSGRTIGDRRMTNPQGDPLRFNLYKDAARTQLWGETGAGATTWAETQLTYGLDWFGSGNSGTRTMTVYGRIPVQTNLAAGAFNSMVNGTVNFRYRDRSTTPSPSSCTDPAATAGVPFRPTMHVSATVPDRCVLRSATDLDFGLLASARTGNLTRTSRISMECTRRTPWQIALDNGQNASGNTRRMRNGSAYLAYELNRGPSGPRWGSTFGVDTLQGTGSGSGQMLTVHGVINDQPLTAAGQYSDTIKVTVQY